MRAIGLGWACLALLLARSVLAEAVCPPGTFAVGATPPEGFEHRCVLPDGRAHGPWRIWYPDGQLLSQTEMANGQQHGAVQAWWPNGQLMMRGQFIQGQRYRQAEYWDVDGQAQTIAVEVLESALPSPAGVQP